MSQLKPSLKASSMSLYLSVIAGTSDDEYRIIFDITDHAYLPYLSFLFINSKRFILSIFKSIFLTGKYSFLFKLRASEFFYSQTYSSYKNLPYLFYLYNQFQLVF